MRSSKYRALCALLYLLSPIDALHAQEATGVWLRENGKSRVRIAPCSDSLCGHIAWLREPSNVASVGQRVFYDMKPEGGGVWKGVAFNPEDGKTYTGELRVSGDRLRTSGCVLGGLICKTVNWIRVK